MKKVFASILLLIGLTASLKSQNKTSILRTPEKRDSVAIDSLIKAAWNVARTDAPQSLSILGQLSNIFDNVSTLYRQDVLFYYYGVVYKNLSRFAESERYLNKYEELHAKTDNKVKLANVNMVKANLFSDQGLWEKSMASVTKSLLYYEQLKDTIGIIRAASKLGYLLTEINRPEDAMKYHKRALHYAQIKKDSSQLSVAFTNIAVVFEKMKKFDSAFHYYANSKNINDQTQSMYGLLYDNFNIGNIYLKKEQLLEAEPYIKKALDLAYQLKIPSEISACRLLLADLYLTQGKTTEGIKQIESELSSNEYPLSLKDQMQGYRSLYEAYKKEGKADQAILNLEKYKAVNDSMVNENTTNRINQLEIQYQTATKEKEIALLNSK
ncbi:MAG: tetratricopeptide repeat protein, partial [Chitinophagaceae bacterium]